MSLVHPFRARMYSEDAGVDLTARIAPPYDVVSPSLRAELLARDSHNAVALELPDGPLDPTLPGNRYETGTATWGAWYSEGILVDDVSPAIYVLEQEWTHGGVPRRRRAFIAAVRLHPFSEKVVLPHERTLPKALDDRLNLTRATAANLSQVFSLFTDPDCATHAIFDAAMAGEPIRYATGVDGVKNTLWALRDPEMIDLLARLVGDGPVYIADGHHRYTTALAYRNERRAQAEAASLTPVDPAYDSVMMALVNMDDPELLVLPTHRLVRAREDFDSATFWAALGDRFDLADLAESQEPVTTGDDGPIRFTVKTADGRMKVASLRPDVDLAAVMGAEHSAAWRHLDVTVLEELVLKPLLGVDPAQPATLDRLQFVHDHSEALKLKDADVAFVLAPTRMAQLREVALAGETMPQKSTYFYPKLPSGLVYRSLD